MRALPLILMAVLCTELSAQRILHFTATSGFDHGTRNVSFAMFQAIAEPHGWEVVDDADGSNFSDLDVLRTFQVVAFCNTSGDAILNDQQRAHFGTWINEGGHLLGIHAASDTYRHSTANGVNTGTWDLYAERLGASVQQDPNHVTGTPPYAMSHIGTHTSTTGLPDPWTKNEEYYYWEGGYFGPDNQTVLQVEQTVGPNGLVNPYDAPRAMSWYRMPADGGRVFYTALGHAASNYTEDDLFRLHISQALEWLLEGTNGIAVREEGSIRLIPNPVDDELRIEGFLGGTVRLMDLQGRVLHDGSMRMGETLPTADVPNGMYLLRVDDRTCLKLQVVH